MDNDKTFRAAFLAELSQVNLSLKCEVITGYSLVHTPEQSIGGIRGVTTASSRSAIL